MGVGRGVDLAGRDPDADTERMFKRGKRVPSVDRSPDGSQRIVFVRSGEAEDDRGRSVPVGLHRTAVRLRRGAYHGRELIQQRVEPFGVERIERVAPARELRGEHRHGLSRGGRLEP